MTRRRQTTILAGALMAGLGACGSTPSSPSGAGGSGAGAGGSLGGAAGTASGGSGGQAGASGAGGGAGSGGSGGHAGVTGAGGGAGSGGSGGHAGVTGAGGGAGSGGSGGHAGGSGAGGGAGAGAGGAAGTGGQPGAGGAAGRPAVDGGADRAPDGPGLSVHELDVHGQRMIYDASRARLYVSAGTEATVNPNTIEIVDAIGETIVSTIPIGGDPGPLALSDDGSTLWVGLAGDTAIRSVDLTTTPPTVNPEHLVPSPGPVTPAQVRTLVVLPGTRTTVVASVSGVIFVFDDGVVRANHGGSVAADRVAIGPTGYVFGDNTENSGYDFTSFAISASGAQMVADVQGLMQSNVDDIIYWSSRVYGYWGEAIDVSDPTKPKRAGKFDFQGAIAGRDATHLLMMSWASLVGANTPQAIRVLDTTTFTQTASVAVPTTLLYNATELLDLCYLGGDRAAFLTQDYDSSNRLFFLETPVIAQ